MAGIEYRRGEYRISTDKTGLDRSFIHDFLSRWSYRAQQRPLAVVEKSIENSLCFGVYDGKTQVGFARVVTDYATFAWLCDVFVAESHRNRGLRKNSIGVTAGSRRGSNRMRGWRVANRPSAWRGLRAGLSPR